jgi:hypothetical protein
MSSVFLPEEAALIATYGVVSVFNPQQLLTDPVPTVRCLSVSNPQPATAHDDDCVVPTLEARGLELIAQHAQRTLDNIGEPSLRKKACADWCLPDDVLVRFLEQYIKDAAVFEKQRAEVFLPCLARERMGTVGRMLKILDAYISNLLLLERTYINMMQRVPVMSHCSEFATIRAVLERARIIGSHTKLPVWEWQKDSNTVLPIAFSTAHRFYVGCRTRDEASA